MYKILKFRKLFKEKPSKYTIDLYGLCDKYGHAEWYQQIVNRMTRELENESEDFPVFDLIDFDIGTRHMVITSSGILYFLHILSGYFDEEALIHTAAYMRRLRRLDDSNRRLNLIETVRDMNPIELAIAVKVCGRVST